MSLDNRFQRTFELALELFSQFLRSPVAVGWRSVSLSACLGLSLMAVVDAKEPANATDESEVLFVRRIEPLLREKCFGCHGQDPELIEGAIDFRAIEPLIAGGDSGEPGIVLGKPDESSIYLAAARGEEEFSAMPPKESEALSKEQLTWLKRWIETGAKWPTKERTKTIETEYAEAWSAEDGVIVATAGGLDSSWTNRRYDPAGLWAYQPVKQAEIRVDQKSSVDHFILDAMPEGLDLRRERTGEP